MKERKKKSKLPIFSLEPEGATANKHFRMYHFKGEVPNRSELLIPHIKDYYLIVFMRKTGHRQWIDMTPYLLKKHRIYFSGPGQMIVKDGFDQLWSTGVAFTKDFLIWQENTSLRNLPIISNPQNVHELQLCTSDVVFVEDLLSKMSLEYQNAGHWQDKMLSVYLILLLTYLSRLYTMQFPERAHHLGGGLVKQFQREIETHFRDLHEVKDYAALLNLSASHLNDVVKEVSGRSAIKHLHERRTLEAKRLLFHTDLSLKEICFDLGFADDSYFNRFFKRETGATPMQYRINNRKMYH